MGRPHPYIFNYISVTKVLLGSPFSSYFFPKDEDLKHCSGRADSTCLLLVLRVPGLQITRGPTKPELVSWMGFIAEEYIQVRQGGSLAVGPTCCGTVQRYVKLWRGSTEAPFHDRPLKHKMLICIHVYSPFCKLCSSLVSSATVIHFTHHQRAATSGIEWGSHYIYLRNTVGAYL